MAPKFRPSLSVFFLAAVALLLLALPYTAEARFRGVSPFCATAGSKAICLRLVGRAFNKQQAMANAIAATTKHAQQMAVLLPTLQKSLSSLIPVARASAFHGCQVSIDQILSDLGSAQKMAQKNDVKQVIKFLSAASFGDCGDGLNELNIGLPRPMKVMSNLYGKYLDACLAVASSKAP